MNLIKKIEKKQIESKLFFELNGDKKYKVVDDTLQWVLSELKQMSCKTCKYEKCDCKSLLAITFDQDGWEHEKINHCSRWESKDD